MKKKKGLIQLTNKGIAYFAIFWMFVALVVYGPPERWEGSAPETPAAGSLTIHFIDVGQADAAVILCGGKTMMIDGGNAEDSSLIYSYLKNTLGISHIDYMIATHPHEDHIGGLSGALNACTVGTVYSTVTEYGSKVFNSLVRYTENQGKTLTVPRTGETIRLGDAQAQIISSGKPYAEINDTSIVVKITFGRKSFLFTGDAEWEAEHDLIESGYDLSADLLKVGHHGSSSSTSYVFLREVMPEYAVISVGEGNTYGHPSASVTSRLRDAGASVYRTDLNGHIVAVSDGKTISITCEKGAAEEGVQTAPVRRLTAFDVLEEMKNDLQRNIRMLWTDLIARIRSIGW